MTTIAGTFIMAFLARTLHQTLVPFLTSFPMIHTTSLVYYSLESYAYSYRKYPTLSFWSTGQKRLEF